ncbi:ATP-binding cassette domain-containing protein [Facklamia sp. P9177]|uniref:ATP-binding cassette domain-containing protein n=1 Tax=Facklamia sp. P9177 TaxID=3421945 RepID=UPI003D1681DC
MLKIEKLQVKYKDFTALDIREEIQINEGDKVGIIGSNGAGKSTLINCIMGLTKYKGNIDTLLEYKDIAVHLQQNGYNEFVDIKTIIEAVINDKIKGNEKIEELIDFFEFRDCLKKRFKKLSGGEKQKLTIILILMQDAKLTIYDEVTSGLDFESRNNLTGKLNELYKDTDKTMLLVSHYYEELENLVNKIILLDKGKVIAQGDVKSLFQEYCGECIILLPEAEETRKISKGHKMLIGGKNTIVLGVNNKSEKETIIEKLIEKEIPFSVKYNDIEVLTLNAKAAYYKERI